MKSRVSGFVMAKREGCGYAFPAVRRPMRFARFFACLLLLLGLVATARGHQVASVELQFLKLDDEWRLEGEMDIAYMLPETRNIPGGLPMSRAAAMLEPPQELARYRSETENTLRKLLRFTFAGKDVPWRVGFPDFEEDPFELPPEAGDIALLTTRIVIGPQPGAGELRIHWAGEQETELIILIGDDEDPEAAIVSTLPGGSLMLRKQTGEGEARPVEQPLGGGWVQLGFSHVMGFDHILFILGLFLLSPRWKPLLQQSLLFTLAHSITLALAVLGVVQVPEKWVEHLIALSIAWVGIENLFSRKLTRQRLVLVFCFGLLHGLGFANVLAAKLARLSDVKPVVPLVGFNVGVEIAQISVLAVAFLLLGPVRKWTLQIQVAGSVFIAIAGLAWAVQRIFFPGSPLL
jgi:hydrogenase/urease accessory protein HupE